MMVELHHVALDRKQCSDLAIPAIGTFYARKMKAGHIYAIAGDGSLKDSGDGGPARRAGLIPGSPVLDAAGLMPRLAMVAGGSLVRQSARLPAGWP
jgi:hypothetical protein